MSLHWPLSWPTYWQTTQLQNQHPKHSHHNLLKRHHCHYSFNSRITPTLPPLYYTTMLQSPTSTGVQPAPTPKPTRQGWDVLMELNFFFFFFMSKKPNQTHCYGSMSFWLKLTNLWTVQAALMFLWKRDGSPHLVDVAPLLRSTGGKEVTPSNFNYIQDPFPQPSPSQDYLNLQLVPFLFKF